MNGLFHQDVCLLSSAPIDVTNKFEAMLLKINAPVSGYNETVVFDQGVKVHTDSKAMPEECLKIEVKIDEGLSSSAAIEVAGPKQLKVSLKSKLSINSKLQQQLHIICTRLGISPFGSKYFSSSQITYDRLNSVHISQFYSSPVSNNSAQFDALVKKVVSRILFNTQLKQIFRPEQVHFSYRIVSAETDSLVHAADNSSLLIDS